MGTMSMCVSLLLSCNFLLLSHSVAAQEQVVARSEREALEIIIGGGGGYGPAPSPSPDECPPPPPPPEPECPPPPKPPQIIKPPPPRPPTMTRLQKARKVLLNFKLNINDTNGYTNNWKKGTYTCNFNGIQCATFPNTKNETAVAGLDLNRAGLSGKGKSPLSLSGILDKIPELTFFHVNSNNFTGAIPKEIVNYKYFFELDLSNNKIPGEFPKEVLQSKQLVFLDLRFNHLYGPIPPELFGLDLDVIFINNNYFSGPLPDNFGSTPARYLTFANNQLTGQIPRSIGKASKTLTEVLFLSNYFEGCLPFEIGYLKKATVFDVSKNLLTGPIPHSFACLQSIQYLNLEKNQFYGTVPEMVCQLPGLRNNGNLSLAYNYFTQVGPACRDLIKAKVLDVSNNCILGLPNQRSHGECTKFFSNAKQCPNPNSFNNVPCKLKGHDTQAQTQTTPPAPLTYKTLKPHRL